MQQGVEQHGAVSGGEHEPVPVGPARGRRRRISGTWSRARSPIGHAHGHSGMTGSCLFDGVDRERPDGVGHPPHVRGRAAQGFSACAVRTGLSAVAPPCLAWDLPDRAGANRRGRRSGQPCGSRARETRSGLLQAGARRLPIAVEKSPPERDSRPLDKPEGEMAGRVRAGEYQNIHDGFAHRADQLQADDQHVGGRKENEGIVVEIETLYDASPSETANRKSVPPNRPIGRDICAAKYTIGNASSPR